MLDVVAFPGIDPFLPENLLIQPIDIRNKIPFYFTVAGMLQRGQDYVIRTKVSLQEKTITWIREMTVALKEFLRRLITQSTINPEHPNSLADIRRLGDLYRQTVEKIEMLSGQLENQAYLETHLTKLQTLHQELKNAIPPLVAYAAELNLYIKPIPLVAEVNTLLTNFRQLDNKFTEIVKKNIPKIQETFQKVLRFLKADQIPLPSLIVSELICNLQTVVSLIEERDSGNPSIAALKKNIATLEANRLLIDSTLPNNPIGMSNIHNSCYIDSSLEAVFCLPLARQFLHRELYPINYFGSPNFRPDPENLRLRKNLQASLLALLDRPLPNETPSLFQYFSTMVNSYRPLQDALRDVRQKIFDSKLNPLLDPSKLTEQDDAAIIVGIFLRDILDQTFVLQKVSCADQVPGRVFYKNEHPSSILSLALPTDNPMSVSLVELIKKNFASRPGEEPYRVTPSEGIIWDEAAAATLSTPVTQPINSNYRSFLKIKTLPTILAIQINRFKCVDMVAGTTIKMTMPVSLPADGIIDLTEYYEPDQPDPRPARYKLKSTVDHLGGLHGGHYTSNVNIGNHYFHCDDMSRPREITATKFFENENSYIIILERVEVEPVEQPEATPAE